MVGMSRAKGSMPKKKPMSRMMAQAAATMAKPIKALVIWLRASSTWALSPPETIHLMPPMMRKAKAISKAPMIARPTPPPMRLPRLVKVT